MQLRGRQIQIPYQIRIDLIINPAFRRRETDGERERTLPNCILQRRWSGFLGRWNFRTAHHVANCG